MMDDDGGCWWVEKESLRRTRKGRNAGASRDMQTAKTCGQATFFFLPPPPVGIYIARLPLCNVEPAGLAFTVPIEKGPVYSCILYMYEHKCSHNLRVGVSALSNLCGFGA